MKRKLLLSLLILCLFISTFAGCIPAQASAAKVYVTANLLTVYKTATTSAEKLGTMSFGEQLECIGTNNDWACVENSSGEVGFCKKSGLSTSNPCNMNDKVYINRDKVNVYDLPDDDSKVLMVVSKGDSYTAVGVTEDNDWYRLKNGKYFGYVEAKYIDEEPETDSGKNESETVYVSSNTLKVYKKASSSSTLLGTMAFGEEMEKIGESGSYAHVRNESGEEGYCKNSGLSTEDPNTLDLDIYITKNNVDVYKHATSSSGKLAVVNKDAEFTAVALTEDGDWYRIEYNNGYAYIKSKYAAKIEAAATPSVTEAPEVTPEPTPAPTEEPTPAPTAEATAEPTAAPTEEPEVSAEPTAAPTAEATAEPTPAPTEEPEVKAEYVYVTANTVTVYKKSTSSSTALGTLCYGERLEKLGEESRYTQVRNASGEVGFCKTSKLSAEDPNTLNFRIHPSKDGVDVYKRPTSSSSKLAKINKDSEYTVVALTPDEDWYRIEYDGGYAYLKAKYAVKSEPEQNAPPAIIDAYVIVNTLDIYADANAASPVLATICFGDHVEQLGTIAEYSLVRSASGVAGFCKTSNISTKDPNILYDRLYIGEDGVAVYAQPSASAEKLAEASTNDEFTAVALTENGEWYRVEFSGSHAYIQAKYLSSLEIEVEPDDEPAEVYVADTLLKVYEKTSTASTVMGIMAFGEKLTRLAVDGEWAKVENASGEVGYCKSSGISKDDPNFLEDVIYVIAEGVNMYKKPQTSASIVKKPDLNEKFTSVALSPDGEWLRIKLGSSYAYMLAIYASNEKFEAQPKEKDVYVHDNTLKVYEKMDTSSKLMGTMAYGEMMVLVSVNDSWACVRNEADQIGYCNYAGLTTANPNKLNETMFVQADGVKIYRRPLTSAVLLSTLNTNNELKVVAETTDGSWYRVELDNGSFGFVECLYLSPDKVPTDPDGMLPVSATKIYVASTTLNIYASMSTSSKNLGTMSFGEMLTCTGVNEQWVRVLNENKTVGYCKKDSIVEENPNGSGMTMYIQSNGVKAYAKPKSSSTVLKTLELNAKVTRVMIGPDGKWARIKLDDGYAYVQAVELSTAEYENPHASRVSRIITLAKDQMDKPYIYGTEGPNSYDCSGLTYYCYEQITGIHLKRSAYLQGYDERYEMIENIADLKVGDIVCFNTNSSDEDLSDHTGIYIGGGQFIHASSAAAKVIISSLSSGYYNRVFSWARRIL